MGKRLQLLKERLAAGKVTFAPHLFDETKKSLMAVRYASDGEVDLATVDARVRALTLAVSMPRG